MDEPTIKIFGLNAVPYAIVKDGVVINRTIWDPNEFPDWKPVEGEAIPCDRKVGNGWFYDGETFSNPNAKPETPFNVEKYRRREIDYINDEFVKISQGILATPTQIEDARAMALQAVLDLKATDVHDEMQIISAMAQAELENIRFDAK